MFADALKVSQEEIDKMKKALKIIKWLAIGIGGAIAGWKLGNLLTSLLGLEGRLLGIGGALAIAGAAIEGFSLADAWKNGFNIENMLGALGGSGGLIAGAALIGKQFGSALIGGGVGAILGGIPMFIVGIKDALMNGLNWINGIIIPAGSTMAMAGVGAIIGAVGGPIGAGVGALIGLCIGLLTDLGIWIKQHWTEIGAWLKKHWENISTWFRNTWNEIKTACENFSAAFRVIWEAFVIWLEGKIVELVRKTVNNFLTMKQNAIDSFTQLTTKIKSAWNETMTFFSSRLTAFRDSFISVFTNIKNGVINVFNQMKTAMKTPINAIINMLNRMISGINNIKIDVPNWVPGEMGGKSLGFKLQKIPLLAEGGYVGPNTPQLAMIGDNRHQGEIVAPENKLNEAVANNVRPVLSAIQQLMSVLISQNQGGGDITIPIYLDGSMLDEYVITAQDRKALRTGGIA